MAQATQHKVLTVKNISKIYKIYPNNLARIKEIFSNKNYHQAFIANHNITFDLYQGETLGIIGVNGAGKSTLLKIIAKVIAPSAGSIQCSGRITALLELGTGFNNQMSGYENISLNGSLIGMSKQEISTVSPAIIDFSELGDYIYQPLRTYSSGMKMRLAFAIALYSEPQILIVDEALSVGDAHFSAKCTQALSLRKAKNMSIIYVSHDLNSLKLLCDRVLLLNHGEIASNGSPEDVINQYNYLISALNKQQHPISINKKTPNGFGNKQLQISKVSIHSNRQNSQRIENSVLCAGELCCIEVHIKTLIDSPNMTIGILIRDKFGQDIFGTNTFHHQLKVNLKANSHSVCRFTMALNIGYGKYSISAAVHTEDTHLKHCSHWLDHAAKFEVAGLKGAQFVGLAKLQPEIKFYPDKAES